MADSKVSALTEDATPALDSLVYTVDDPAGTPVSRRTPLSDVRSVLSTYDVIIAASGGDHTTLNSYFTAGATSGDKIFVEDSHTLSASISDSTTNLVIDGAGREGTRVDLATNNVSLTLSGAGVEMEDLGF